MRRLIAALCLMPCALLAQGDIALPMSDALEQAREDWLNNRFDGIYEVIEPLAEAGDPVAQNLLGVSLTEHDSNRGIAYDPERGFALLQAASDAGFARATYNLALVYGEEHGDFAPDYDRKLDLARTSAEAGYAPSWNLIGDMYHGGNGVDQSFEEALSYYRRAADAGVTNGLRAVGYAYFHGQGVTKDVGLAERYLDRAVAAGDRQAIRDLAWLYEGNEGVGQDLVKAYFLYREGIRRGDPRSAYELAWFVAWEDYPGFWHDKVQGYGYCLLALDWGHRLSEGDLAVECEEIAEGFTEAQRAEAAAFRDSQ